MLRCVNVDASAYARTICCVFNALEPTAVLSKAAPIILTPYSMEHRADDACILLLGPGSDDSAACPKVIRPVAVIGMVGTLEQIHCSIPTRSCSAV